MQTPNASAARVDGSAPASQRNQKRACSSRQGGGQPCPGRTRPGAPAPAARCPKVALFGPERGRSPTRSGASPPPGRPAGDLAHAMVRLDESAIAGNVGRDLAFAASRLAARSHPGVGGSAAPSSLHMFGIFAGDRGVRRGCSSPGGQRCSCLACTRHDRAHIFRGQDDRGRLQSRAAGCSRRAASCGRPNGFPGWHGRASVWIATSCHQRPRDHVHGSA